MKGTITTLFTVCPIRSKPDDTAEMVSQILFGERAEVIEKGKEDWIRIKCSYDNFSGWADAKQFKMIDHNDGEVFYCADLFGAIFGDDHSTWISMGAELPGYDGMTTTLAGQVFRYSGNVVSPSQPNGDPIEQIDRIARKLLNVPHLWGGRSPAGMDCSGFTQIVFKCLGIVLDRDSKDQAMQGDMVDFASSARPGDLAFFTKNTENISHVGIILSDEKIIHCSGSVRIDSYDHYGIFNKDIQQYTHRLKIIKRYL